MRLRSAAVLFVLAASLATAAAAAGCGDDGAPVANLDDVIFEGAASDEAWVAVAEAATSPDPSGAGWVFAPTSFLRSGTTPTFTWTPPAPGVHGPRRTPSRTPAFDEQPLDYFARGLSEFVHPVAHAHLPPVTGDVYRLIFTVPDQPTPLRVLTTDHSYSPGGTAFAKLASATGPISLELVHAYLMQGRVMEGPYRLPEILIVPE